MSDKMVYGHPFASMVSVGKSIKRIHDELPEGDDVRDDLMKAGVHLREAYQKLRRRALEEFDIDTCEECDKPISPSDVAAYEANGGAGSPSVCEDCAEKESR